MPKTLMLGGVEGLFQGEGIIPKSRPQTVARSSFGLGLGRLKNHRRRVFFAELGFRVQGSGLKV